MGTTIAIRIRVVIGMATVTIVDLVMAVVVAGEDARRTRTPVAGLLEVARRIHLAVELLVAAVLVSPRDGKVVSTSHGVA